MTLKVRLSHNPTLRRTAVGIAMVAACASASAALPQFTFDPGASMLNGASFTGDNLLISDYSTVKRDDAGGFTDTGYLSISAIQLAGSTFTPTGLNSTYGMYIKFDGKGTTTPGDPKTAVTVGNFTELSYTLFGYNGTASFGFDPADINKPTITPPGGVALATGTLVSGNAVTIPTGDGLTFTPSATAKLNFVVTPGQEKFFASPNPFYNLAFAAFTNTTTQVEAFDGGFRIRQGGGALNFASAVPEPESYALMLAGLAAVGFVSRRLRT